MFGFICYLLYVYNNLKKGKPFLSLAIPMVIFFKNVWEKSCNHWNIQMEVNPFPHINAFWRLCSRQLFENIVTKEENAFSDFATMFSTLHHRSSIFWQTLFKVFCCRIVVWGKGLNIELKTLSKRNDQKWAFFFFLFSPYFWNCLRCVK